MRTLHEATYTYVYVLPRGAFKRELTRYLRRCHRFRRPRKIRLSSRPVQVLVSIDDRPAEVADRTVPGHWEGDLLVGQANASALGTLVEGTHSVYAAGAAESQGCDRGAAGLCS